MSDMQLSGITKKVRGIMAQYGKTFDVDIDSDWYVMKLQEELGELTQKYLMMTGRTRRKPANKKVAKKEFSNEIADVLCLTLLLADRCKVKLEDSIQTKWYAYAK